MKKFLIVIMAVACAAAFMPQNASAGVGIKGGLNFANMSVKPVSEGMPDFENLTGLTGGLYFSLNIGFIGIEPEILYSRRGLQWEEGTTNIKYELDYVEVPVLVKLNILPAGPVRPYVFGGPSYGYLLKATGKLTAAEGNESQDIKDMFKKSEWAAVFGAGIELKAIVRLSVDARYHLGISNIEASTEGTETVKNKGFSVMVGIGF